MYERLKGKKLLVIGSGEEDANIVRTAHELGIYTIVADGVPKGAGTFAKNIADESWDMDYTQTEAIGKKCISNNVNGVIAGYSEFRVEAACKIAKYIGTPFYATEEQIELTRNKRLFKDRCMQYGVKVPKDYLLSYSDISTLDGINYPVIVKPTDAAGRKGITICYGEKQLQKAVETALKYSVSKTVIIEEYIIGKEFVAVYTIQDGFYSLSCFNEKYINRGSGNTVLCDLALTPSEHMAQYIEKTDQSIKSFLRGIGVDNGVAFFQGIATNNDIYVFEMGLRLNGGNDYFIAEKENGISYMKMLISFSLTGEMIGDIKKDNPLFSQYYANYLLYAHGGEVGEISFDGDVHYRGLEDIHIKKVPGMQIKEDGTTQQGVFTFKLTAKSIPELINLIKYCQKHARIRNNEGKNMMFEPFDTNILNMAGNNT